MVVFLAIGCAVVTIALCACMIVFFYLLWETRRVLLDLSEAVMQFAVTTKQGPAFLEEAVTSLREIRTAVDGQASRRRYTRPGRREDQAPPDEMPERVYRNPLDEVQREGAEVGNL
jgi:hypothetical protein